MQRILTSFAHLLLVLSLAVLPLRASFAMPEADGHCKSHQDPAAMNNASHMPTTHAHHRQSMSAREAAGTDDTGTPGTMAGCGCCDDCTAACMGCIHTSAAITGLENSAPIPCTDEQPQFGSFHYLNFETPPPLRPPRA